ncbi:CGNR zinc finger domain-containing protein [Tellurirhabdus rosea]|uniref:CGNR zinc finger domain-containing protein n=1 Tax=Tellurirhabdus rosea TaxID=2674997 RepID=UPI00225768D0|nr:CGNR zinc finger domain-containing protein [Tellurirhabdus rosea]
MDLLGGAACLDLVNTALEFDEPVERLHTYQDLLTLVRRLSLLSADTLTALERSAEEDSRQAERVLLKARQFRQSMLTIFAALVEGTLDNVSVSVLKTFNGFINEALDRQGFLPQANKLVRSQEHPQSELMQAVWVFCLSAYNLLSTQDQSLIKQCGGCAWFFLDTTKNHRRKWCDMQSCGSNEKARRYYQRKKQA